jgi:hypothetical protein
MNSEADVRPVLPAIRVPTLVVHRTGDLCLHVEEGVPSQKAFPAPGSWNCRGCHRRCRRGIRGALAGEAGLTNLGETPRANTALH